MEIIDAHAHIYPDKIAEKASIAIGEFYDLHMCYKGDVKTLLEVGKKAGVSRYLVHSVATTPKQVHSINEFLYAELQAHPEFIGFIALHPALSKEEVEAEIAWGLERGFKGIKLHPDFQKFNIDDPEAFKIYEAAKGKMVILFHTGDHRYDFSTQIRLVNVANQFPDLKVIASHFGGWSVWDKSDVYKMAKYDNIYFDTSSSLAFLEPKRVEEIIHTFGANHFFFGTDYPMWDATDELNLFNRLNLTDEEKTLILGENFKKLLNL